MGAVSDPRDAALVREALRLYRRYATEMVEPLKLCPWAERARLEGRVAERALLTDATAPFTEPLAVMAELGGDPHVEIGILVFPRLQLGRRDFEHWVARLRDRDAERYPLGAVPFAAAAFHPDAEPNHEDAERCIPFMRRTPDPTLQLVRRSSLDRVRGRSTQGTQFVDLRLLTPEALTGPELSSQRDRIAEANLETLKRLGPAEFERRFAAIARDRASTYAQLGLTFPAPSDRDRS